MDFARSSLIAILEAAIEILAFLYSIYRDWQLLSKVLGRGLSQQYLEMLKIFCMQSPLL